MLHTVMSFKKLVTITASSVSHFYELLCIFAAQVALKLQQIEVKDPKTFAAITATL